MSAADAHRDRPPSHLQVADRAFAVLSCPPRPLTVDCAALPEPGRSAAAAAGLPAGPVPLLALRARLLDRRTPYLVRDAVWRELVLRARRDGGVWLIAVVGMAMPRLVRDAGRLTRGFDGDPADVDNALLEGFLHAVTRTLDPDGTGLYAKACWAGFRAGHTVRHADSGLVALHELGLDRAAAPHRPYGHPDLLLARAVAVGVLDPAEADLIDRTRLEGEPVERLARAAGLEPSVLRMRRRRAERRLARAILDGTLSGPVSPHARHRLAAAARRRRTARTPTTPPTP